MGKHLNEAEKQFILNSASTMSDKDLAAKLTELRGARVTKESIGAYRRRSGLTKTRGRNSKLVVPHLSNYEAPAAGEGGGTAVPGEAQGTNE